MDMREVAMAGTVSYFEEKSDHFQYEIVGEQMNTIRAGFAMENRDGIYINMTFDEEGESAKLTTFNLVKFPATKLADMYKACNDMNAAYRWIKFYVDESDNTITAQDDAVIDPYHCGEEIFQCCLQMLTICDKAYPVFMRAIYS